VNVAYNTSCSTELAIGCVAGLLYTRKDSSPNMAHHPKIIQSRGLGKQNQEEKEENAQKI
jgi:hypothetical protein